MSESVTAGQAGLSLSELLTAQDLASRWRCTVGHLANMRSAGTGPAFLKIGGVVRYRVVDLERYEEAHLVDTV